ncbi:MAG: DnaJ domain-containing protein [Candidatus Atelocyanobacterium thalassa]
MQQIHNYYATLEVAKNATAEEIKASFRKLARKYHPDVNPGDKVSEERFKSINEAYNVLSDETKRADYNRLKFSKKRYDSFIANSHSNKKKNKSSKFKDINFNSDTNKRTKFVSSSYNAQDVEAKLSIPLEKAYHGGRERIRLEDGRSLEVDMPSKMVNGQKIRLKNQGLSGGDLYLEILITPHIFFKLKNADIICKILLTPSEAILGEEITVPTIDGMVKITTPKSIQVGQKLRLANKGYFDELGQRGDQLLEMHIAIPSEISEEELFLYKQIRSKEEFNPRKYTT